MRFSRHRAQIRLNARVCCDAKVTWRAKLPSAKTFGWRGISIQRRIWLDFDSPTSGTTTSMTSSALLLPAKPIAKISQGLAPVKLRPIPRKRLWQLGEHPTAGGSTAEISCRKAKGLSRAMPRLEVLIHIFDFRIILATPVDCVDYKAKAHSIPIAPRLRQPPAASF